MLSAIAYMHDRQIVHRDLKPENILIEKNKPFDTIKLIDFGTAVLFNKGTPLREVIGTPYYIAPEVLNKKYDSKCDIWSLGVITFILLSGIPPFNGKDDDEIFARIKRGNFSFENRVWHKVSNEAKDFIQ